MNKRIVIIGGGVVGLATAWELIKRGHQAHHWSVRRTGRRHRFATTGQID